MEHSFGMEREADSKEDPPSTENEVLDPRDEDACSEEVLPEHRWTPDIVANVFPGSGAL